MPTRFSFFMMCWMFVALTVVAQRPAERHHLIHIEAAQADLLDDLQTAGLALDHLHQQAGVVALVLSEREVQSLRNQGIEFRIVQEDAGRFYAARARQDLPEALRAQKQASGPDFPLGSMGGFYTLAEVERELDRLAADFPHLVTTKTTIGTSIQGRPIWMVKLSDQPQQDEIEPEVLYTALTHAREPQGMMTLLYFMRYLAEGYGTDAEATYLLNNRELYFVPVVNPDGFVLNEQVYMDSGGEEFGFWRKNARDNGNGTLGVDLNRNFGYQWGFDNVGSSTDPQSNGYRGTAPFSEPETAALRDLCLARDFVMALNYHTYGNLLIYPFGYRANRPTPDATHFERYATDMVRFNGYHAGTALQTVRYTANGNSDDWMYGEQTLKNKIFSMTPEVGRGEDGFWPAATRIIPLAEENVHPNLYLAHAAGRDIFNITPEIISAKLNPDRSVTIDVVFHVENKGLIHQDNTVSLQAPAAQKQGASSLGRLDLGEMGTSDVFSFTTQTYPQALEIAVTVQEDLGEQVDQARRIGHPQDLMITLDDVPVLTEEPFLWANYPNPMRTTTRLTFGFPETQNVRLTIHNVLGQTVRTLQTGSISAGLHVVDWDGRTDQHIPVPAGLYFYRLEAADFVEIKSITVIR